MIMLLSVIVSATSGVSAKTCVVLFAGLLIFVVLIVLYKGVYL